MKSMTGYAKAEKKEGGIRTIIEIKSLNNRYCEINCKIPKTLSSKEIEVRNLIRENISRGSLTVTITIEYEDEPLPFSLNEQVAEKIYESLSNLSKKLNIEEKVTISDILSFPNYLLFNEIRTNESEAEWKIVKKGLIEALKKLNEYRRAEGKAIYKDITNRVKKLSGILKKIKGLSQSKLEIEIQKLREKVKKIINNQEIDEQRMHLEIALLANKFDISEECLRLESHLNFLEETIKSKEPVGQKINFILQEISREFNTVSSKSDDAEISKLIVNAKEEVEKIREQVQNIE
ncbi:MAG: YicC family protein [Ignavibacteria bacterium]|nr:YicC family protein [Ignavibacteria bacterium]